jgi:hypothetical protein
VERRLRSTPAVPVAVGSSPFPRPIRAQLADDMDMAGWRGDRS